MSDMCVVAHARDWRRPERTEASRLTTRLLQHGVSRHHSSLVCRVTTFCCPSMKRCVAGMLCYVGREYISRCWSYASLS